MFTTRRQQGWLTHSRFSCGTVQYPSQTSWLFTEEFIHWQWLLMLQNLRNRLIIAQPECPLWALLLMSAMVLQFQWVGPYFSYIGKENGIEVQRKGHERGDMMWNFRSRAGLVLGRDWPEDFGCHSASNQSHEWKCTARARVYLWPLH